MVRVLWVFSYLNWPQTSLENCTCKPPSPSARLILNKEIKRRGWTKKELLTRRETIQGSGASIPAPVNSPAKKVILEGFGFLFKNLEVGLKLNHDLGQ